MKKYLLGLIAITMAFALCAFTTPKNGKTDYSWFDQSNHTFAGITQSLSENPYGCYHDGSDCLKGYEGDFSNLSEPASGYVISYGHEE